MDAKAHTSIGLASAALGRRLAVAALVLGSALFLFSPASALAATGDITTVAGNGFDGYSGDGGPATSAALRAPAGVAFSGSDLFIADFNAHTVRRVSSGGTISTTAGTGTAGYSGDGGPGSSARLDMPGDVVTDAAGNIYIADFSNSRVRRVSTGGPSRRTPAPAPPATAATAGPRSPPGCPAPRALTSMAPATST
jgi:hypothetical protein